MPDFKDITGHERIIKSLKESIKSNMVSHAYIFCGLKGSGKKLIANAFAKVLNCQNIQNEESCGKCHSCIQFESRNNPDVFYVKATKTKSISVDDIREQIVEKVKTKPYSYKYKIFIIDKADTLTVQAQNALLKTLEEPPEYVVIMLLTQNIESFLPTVLSRCVVMKLRPISADKIKEYIMSFKGLNETSARFYSQYCGGSIGEALRLSEDEEFYAMRQDVIDCLNKLDSLDTASVMLMAKDIEKYKQYPELFDIMYMFYRDVLCYKILKDENRIIEKDKTEDIKRQAKILDEKVISRRLEAVINVKKQLKQNTPFQLSVEVLFMNMKEN